MPDCLIIASGQDLNHTRLLDHSPWARQNICLTAGSWPEGVPKCVCSLQEVQDARKQKRLADGERLTRQSQLEEHQTQLDPTFLGDVLEELQREWDALEFEDQKIQSRVGYCLQ